MVVSLLLFCMPVILCFLGWFGWLVSNYFFQFPVNDYIGNNARKTEMKLQRSAKVISFTVMIKFSLFNLCYSMFVVY